MRKRRTSSQHPSIGATAEQRPPQRAVVPLLSRAREIIEAGDFPEAIGLYRRVLDADLPDPLRGEVLTNLGAALCLAAEGRSEPEALEYLKEASGLLTVALSYRTRPAAPTEWATTRANLALVYLNRYRFSGRQEDLMSAHLALYGTQETLRDQDAVALQDWVAAIRDQVTESLERRSSRR